MKSFLFFTFFLATVSPCLASQADQKRAQIVSPASKQLEHSLKKSDSIEKEDVLPRSYSPENGRLQLQMLPGGPPANAEILKQKESVEPKNKKLVE